MIQILKNINNNNKNNRLSKEVDGEISRGPTTLDTLYTRDPYIHLYVYKGLLLFLFSK